MSDDPEVEVTGAPEETPAEPAPAEPIPPPVPLEPSPIPATEPSEPAAAPTETDTPASDPVVPEAGVVEVPPEPVAPPPPPPLGDAVAALDTADDQARAAQAQREAEAFALSTNSPPPSPSIPPPPLASIADVPSNPIPDPSATAENSIWICVTEEGPRTSVKGVACPVFAVAKLPAQGKLIACPTCGNTVVRRATGEEQRLLQTTAA